MDNDERSTPGTPAWNEVRALFETCLHLSGAQRESILEAATQGKPELRAEVEALLEDTEAAAPPAKASDDVSVALTLTERFESLGNAFKWVFRVGLVLLLLFVVTKGASLFTILARRGADISAARGGRAPATAPTPAPSP